MALLLPCLACSPSLQPLGATRAAVLRAANRASQPQLRQLSAEARITYFGPAGRLRSRASLLLQRPAALRLDLLGPHGGLLLALASDGAQLQVLEVGANRLRCGAASAASLATLLGLPIQLPPAALLDLLLGAIAPDPQAQLQARGDQVVARWTADGLAYQLDLDGHSGRPQAVQICRLEGPLWRLRAQLAAPHPSGIPTQVQLWLAQANSQAELQVRLRDIEVDAPVAATSFVLQPPRGMACQPLR